MIVKVTGVARAEFPSHSQKQQTKYYFPQEKKSKVKEDFGIILDAEMKKLKINVLI